MKRRFGTLLSTLALLALCLSASAYTSTQSVALGAQNAGLAGSVGYTELSPADGSTVQARTTSGVYETGGGGYGASVTSPDATPVVLLWDAGDSATYAAGEINPPGASALAAVVGFGVARAGLPGVGFTLLTASTGAVAGTRTTTGVIEVVAGIYAVSIPAANAGEVVNWDTGEATPAYASSVLTAASSGGGGGSSTPTLVPISSSTAQVGGKFVVAWTADQAATSYEVFRSQEGGPALLIATASANVTTFTDTSPVAGAAIYSVFALH